jgi:hypothetical protein
MQEHAIDNPTDLLHPECRIIDGITVVRDSFMIHVVEIIYYIGGIDKESDALIYS